MDAAQRQDDQSSDRAEPELSRSDAGPFCIEPGFEAGHVGAGQWCPRTLDLRAAREALGLSAGEPTAQARPQNQPWEEVAVERTQAASLALLARRVRAEREVGGVAS